MSKMLLPFSLAIFYLLPLVSTTTAFAASGTIEGVVRDAQTGDPLPGANIVIVRTSTGASTDVNGKYLIQNVPPGSFTLRATYVGYNQKEAAVTVKEGETLKHDFKLVSVGVEGEEVVVTAQAQGQKEAINQQLASMPITNVVSRARIQELPDVNAAESVSRLPGVSLIRTGGEGSKVVIRGLSPQYNQITIEGVEQPSNVNSANTLTWFSVYDAGTTLPDVLGDRGMDLSMISSSQLGGIEVIKAITPDMDASVLGGVVNFDMRKAARNNLAAEEDLTWVPKLELVSQAGYNNLTETFGDYKLVGSAETRLSQQSFGVFLQGSAERRNLSANEVSADYSLYDKDHGEAGLPEINGVTLADVARTRERVGGTLVLDYQHDAGSIGLMNALSSSRTTATRNLESMAWRSNNISWTVEDTDNRLTNLSNILSVKQDIGFVRLNLKASHNYSESSNPEDLAVGIQQSTVTGFENRGNLAKLTPRDYASLATPNPDYSWFTSIRQQGEVTEERTWNAGLDLETPVPISSELTGRLKVGGAYMYRTRDYDFTRTLDVGGLDDRQPVIDYILGVYPSWASVNYSRRIGMYPFLDEDADPGNFLNGEYPLGYLLKTEPMRQFLGVFKGYHPPTYYNSQIYNSFNDYSGNEKKSAAYAMFTLNIGDNVRILPGVRYQHLTTTYSAFRGRLLPGEQIQRSDTTVTQSHGYWLPMVHARYQPLEWLQIHFAYTNTLNYPDYSTITPRYMVGDWAVVYNNWRLKPAHSENFDLVLAFHSNTIGLFSIDGFKKRITDLVFSSRTYVSDLSIYDDLPKLKGQLWEFNTYVNNSLPIDVWGIESEWQTNLWYLPKPFDGLVLNVNYTHIYSEANYPRSIVNASYDDEGNMIRTVTDTFYTTRLLYQPNDILNLSFGYDYRGFSVRLSLLYQDNIFKRPDFWMQNRIYSAKFTRWDLSLKQDLPWLGMQLYMFLSNLSGAEEIDVNQKTLYPANIQLYGMSADLGLRIRI